MSIEEQINGTTETAAPEVQQEAATMQESPSFWAGVKSKLGFLWNDSPDKPVESYINHPLNYKHDAGLAQMLRGIEGWVGLGTNKATLDVFIGLIRLRANKGATVDATERETHTAE